MRVYTAPVLQKYTRGHFVKFFDFDPFLCLGYKFYNCAAGSLVLTPSVHVCGTTIAGYELNLFGHINIRSNKMNALLASMDHLLHALGLMVDRCNGCFIVFGMFTVITCTYIKCLNKTIIILNVVKVVIAHWVSRLKW